MKTMKFHLLKQQRVEVRQERHDFCARPYVKLHIDTEITSSGIQAADSTTETDDAFSNDWIDKLKSQLFLNNKTDSTAHIELTIGNLSEVPPDKSSLRATIYRHKQPISLSLNWSHLSKLVKLCNFKLNAEVDLHFSFTNGPTLPVTTFGAVLQGNNMKYYHSTKTFVGRPGDGLVFGQSWYKSQTAKNNVDSLKRTNLGQGVITVSLIVEENDQLFLNSHPIQRKQSIFRIENFTDCIIITGDGTLVKCHQAFLAANSPVFKAMLETEMQERVTGQITMMDMSDKAVRALLDYFYGRKLKTCLSDPSIAFALFQAAHKYHVSELYDDTERILLSQLKGNMMWTPTVFKLYSFCRLIPETVRVRQIKETIIASCKKNSSKLSGELQALRNVDPEAATELYNAVNQEDVLARVRILLR